MNTVVLESFVDGDRKIDVINVVREITGLGLHETKELVEAAPTRVKDGVTKAVAEAMKKKLEDAGAKASLRADCSCCAEGLPRGECPKSERACGHHCNHSWSHDECHWCGATFVSEDAGASAS